MSADDPNLNVVPNQVREPCPQAIPDLIVPNSQAPPTTSSKAIDHIGAHRMASASAPPPQLARSYDSVSYVRIRRHGMRITGVSVGVPLTESTRPYTLCFIGATPSAAPSAATSATYASASASADGDGTFARDAKCDTGAGCSSASDDVGNVHQSPTTSSQECTPSSSVSLTLSPHSDAGTLTATTTPSSTASEKPQAVAYPYPPVSSSDASAGGTGIEMCTGKRTLIDEADQRTYLEGQSAGGGGDSTSTTCTSDGGTGSFCNQTLTAQSDQFPGSGRTSRVSADECNSQDVAPSANGAKFASADVLEGAGPQTPHVRNVIVPVFPVFARLRNHQTDASS